MNPDITQPLINIGLLGHVANGKSSLVRSITGEKTARGDSRCMQKGESREMTIQIGYSNAKIYQCDHCPKPDCFASIEGSKKQIPCCDHCGEKDAMKLVQFVSFVDAPGHRSLMQNMISGAAVMDGVILVVAANKDVPQIQTLEHLTAAEIVGINHYIAIAQNKIDLLLNDPKCKERLAKNYAQIQDFVKDSGADTSKTPVVPTCVSPARQIGLKLILQHLVERAQPNPHPAYAGYPMFVHCVRSFDVNKPCPATSSSVERPRTSLKGGIIGGTIMHGVLKIGDTLEIRPGYKSDTGEYHPLYTKVTSLYTGSIPLQEARPGGLIGIGTTLDPSLTRSDTMVGMCAGYPDQLPDATTTLEVKIFLLMAGIGHDQEVQTKVSKLRTGEVLQLAIGSAIVTSKLVKRMGKSVYRLETAFPVCPVPGQSIPVSKVIDNAWTIIGKAHLADSVDVDVPPPITTTYEPYHDLLNQILEDTEPLPDLGVQTLPAPTLHKDGGARLVWTNFQQTCQMLNREEAHIQAFFHDELSTRITLNGAHEMIIHGKNRYEVRHVQNILVKYITTYVNCPSCRSVHTTLTRAPGSKYTQLLCQNCGAEYLK